MSKSKFIKTGPSLPVRLAKMGSLPSSEDLKYMLATAAKEGKQVELPFMNPETDLNFMVKVIAASSPVASPRWTFGRLENGVFKHVWSKESNEVIMIQGKIKVDGASKGEYESVDNYEHSSIKAHQGALAPAFGWKRREKDFGFESQPPDQELDPGFATGLSPYDCDQPAFQNNTGSFGTTSFEFDRPQVAETEADSTQAHFSVSHPVSQTGEFQPFLLPPASLPFAKFDQAPKKLPPPVEFDQDLEEAFSILGDPETGLLCYSAFSFFLMREFEHSLQGSQDLAVIVFEVLDKHTLASTELSINDGAAVTEAFNSIRASLDFCARSEESEFAIVLPYYNSQDAVSFAASLYTCLSENLILATGENGDQERVFTIGVAGRTNGVKDAGTLFACARKAKEDARNSSCPYLLFQ